MVNTTFGYLITCSLLFVCCIATSENGEGAIKRWIVLVAGSNGFVNYRHQADVAHAYHLLLKHGIPAERIITFAYDDIAYNSENPFPGKIFNDYSHTDYYDGFVIDYKGKDVTPTMFTRVLKGDSELKRKGLKVLDSGPNDHVFIYFTDHGDADIIYFLDDELHADELNDTINYMYQRKRYGKLVFYMEACESGSMFNHTLSSNINVFVTTAANPEEAGFATFCEDKEIGTCLGDEYSFNWMTDSETHDLTKLTLQQQFSDVRKKTVRSHVQEYGDMSIGNLTVSQFMGDRIVPSSSSNQTTVGFPNGCDCIADNHSLIDFLIPPTACVQEIRDSVPSRQAHIHAMMRAMLRAKSMTDHNLARRRLMHAIKLGELAVETMNLIVETVQLNSVNMILQPVSIEQSVKCYKTTYTSFKRRCFSIQMVPEVAGHVKKLRNLCADGVDASYILAAIEKNCH